MKRPPIRKVDVLLACSSGGHLSQLLALQEAVGASSYLWVTENTSDSRSLLRDEPVVYAHSPAHRNLENGILRIAYAWLRNCLLALRLVARARPAVVLTTGAAIAVPFAWVARLTGARVVYVESLTRIESPSLCCRLISPVADRIYVQWPELIGAVPKGRYVGSILGSR
jgi:UDP-N-acetylglucosamine:LPS N-acetylglucosamine transferase